MSDLVIGVDIGSTNIRVGVVDDKGKILKRERIKTLPELEPGRVVERIGTVIKRFLLKYQSVKGMGVGVAGIVNSSEGVVRIPPNLPQWKEVPLRDLMEKETGLKTTITNDVNAWTIGEFLFGAGKGKRDIFCLTLGTGVGGGVISGGRLLVGANYAAVEFGHTVIKFDGPRCRCGNYGCLERFAGSKYIVDMAKRMIRKRESVLKDKEEINPKIIAIAAKKGDRVAREVMERVGYYVGIGIVNAIHMFDPEVVIIGGGVAKAGRILLEPIKRTVFKRIMKLKGRRINIVLAKLGEGAGIIGASFFFRLLPSPLLPLQ